MALPPSNTLFVDPANADNVTIYATIQAAVNAANAGDTIIVGPGTFAEALSINKEIHIVGAGSGDNPATATIIDPPVNTSFGVTFFGLSDGSSLSSVRVTGGATGISLEDGTGDLTFTDVAAVGNTLYGLNYRTGAGQAVGEVTVVDSVFSDNGSVGLRMASAGSHAHLSVTGSTFGSNGVSGLNTQGNTLASISVQDSSFANNGTAGGSGHGDLILFSFTGDAELKNLTISGDGSGSNALQITGITAGSGAEPDPRKAVVPVGTVVVDGITITGSYARDVVQVGRFTDLAGLSISDLHVLATQGTAPGWAQVSFFNVGGDVDLAAFGLASGLRTNINTNNGVDFASAPDATTGAALTGGSGNDGLVGYVLNDTLSGGDGNDTLVGGLGNDNLNGGAGDDYILADAGNDTIDGGDGTDTLDMSGAGSVGAFVDLASGLAFSSATGIDSIANIENVVGSSGNDGLFGDAGANVFTASGGSDVIDGRGGSDTFDASAATAAVVVNLTTGAVTGAHTATLTSIENVRTGAGNDVVTGSAGDNTIATGAGNDTVIASGGNDVINGGAGMDTVTFAGNRAAYTITWDGTTATVSGGGGTVTITNAGRLDFADKDVFLVDDGSAEFATIGAALTAAANGDEILVAAGTYAETLAINKGVSIFGANAGLAGSDTGRGAEAIIDGTVTIGAASAVTIDGMMFLNNDPVPRAGVDALFITTGAGHVVTNTVFQSSVTGGGTTGRGDVAIYTTVLTSGSVTITDNLIAGDGTFAAGAQFSNAAWSRGIWSNVNGATLLIDGNTFENARTAINQEGWNDAATTISNNTVINSGSGISLGNPASGTITGITGNSFTNVGTDFNLQNLTGAVTFDAGASGNTAPEIMTVLGGAGADVLGGTGGVDTIAGRAGNDTITGGDGNDSVDGGADSDTFVVSGNVADYTWAGTAALLTLTDTAGTDGVDTLANVEFIQFGDVTLSTAELFANVKLYDADGNLKGGFATIQAAITAATGGIGERIEVAAGSYAETVTVSKSVSILGANAGIAHDGTRSTETTLNGLFVLAADGVTIDGFTINGGGTQGSGVRGSGSFVADDITISNNLFTGQTGQPVLYGFGSGGAGATNWTVTDNKVSGITGASATAMVFFDIDGLTVTGNLIEHDNTALAGRRGINLDGIQNGTISDNVLSFGSVTNTSWGIQLSMSNGATESLTISGNTVSAVALAISLLSQRSATGLTITDNVLSGTNGVVLNTGGTVPQVAGVTMSDIEVTGNTITATGFAVFLRDLHNGATNGPVVFDGVDVSTNTIVSGIVQVGRVETDGGKLVNITGTNTFEGSSNNDVVLVEATGSVAFFGGDGNDTFAPGAGGGSFDGGNGTDTVDYSNAASGVTLNLATGTATGPSVVTLTSVENVIGSANADSLTGNAGSNVLQGGDGDDVLAGAGGDDTLDGGNGQDTADYSASTAAVFANALLGAAFGADIGNDLLISVENLIGGAGNDALVAGNGGGRLDGGAGNDTLTGGTGNDTLVAGTGTDVLSGGAGTDTAVFGDDWVSYAITQTGGVFTITKGANSASVTGVENFIFNSVSYDASQIVNSAPDDILFADAMPSVDENAAGATITRLGATDPNPGDTVTLTVDDTRFEIVAAVDPGLPWVLRLKAGVELDYESVQSITLNITATDSKGATRVEQLIVAVNNVNEAPDTGPSLGVWTPAAVETGAIGAALFPEAGVTDPDGDTLIYTLLSGPSAGRLLLNGVEVMANDTLSGAALEALVYETLGVAPGSYSASFQVSDAEFDVPLTLALQVVAGINSVITGTAGNDTLDGAAGADTVRGLVGDDLLYGGGGNDRLQGGDGNDTLYGGAGKDNLQGGNGADLLFGGASDDVLSGGVGNDTADGGAGADTFRFLSVAADIGKFARLTITDFTSGEDKIDLRVFGGLNFVGNSQFSGTAAEVRYLAGSSLLAIDWNADGAVDYRIQLQSGAAFTAATDLLL